MPIYEWDDAKRAQNLQRHGVDFEAVRLLDWALTLTYRQSHRAEVRFASYGPIAGRLHCVIWTERGEILRIISVRKANRREERAYETAKTEAYQSDARGRRGD